LKHSASAFVWAAQAVKAVCIHGSAGHAAKIRHNAGIAQA
jgi:hypothetical protein